MPNYTIAVKDNDGQDLLIRGINREEEAIAEILTGRFGEYRGATSKTTVCYNSTDINMAYVKHGNRFFQVKDLSKAGILEAEEYTISVNRGLPGTYYLDAAEILSQDASVLLSFGELDKNLDRVMRVAHRGISFYYSLSTPERELVIPAIMNVLPEELKASGYNWSEVLKSYQKLVLDPDDVIIRYMENELSTTKK